jgi:predicted GNAT family acetyltransferase
MMTNNGDAHRFELSENGHTAYADYRLDGARLYIDYVEAPPPLRGTGAAGRLMADIMAWARERGLEVVPVCGYAAAWIRRHPQA